MRATQYLLLVQHVELIPGAHADSGVPAVGLGTAVGGAVVDGTLVRGAAEGGTVEGGAIVDGTVEGGTIVGRAFEGRALVGRAFVDKGGSLEGAGVGAMVVVVMIGGGDSTPCIWTGDREERGVGRRGGSGRGAEEEREGQLGSLAAGQHVSVPITSVSGVV